MAAEANNQVDEQRQKVIQAYNELFRSENGRIVLEDLMQHTGVLTDGFSPESAYMMAYNEGQRSVGLYLLHTLQMSWTDLIDNNRQTRAIMEDD